MYILHRDYECLDVIGQGSQGTTWRARHVDSGAFVAIKVMDFGAASNWKDIELFEREAAALEGIDHPSIPKYIDAWRVEEGASVKMCLAQEFVQGLDLRKELAQNGRWSEEQALDATRQVLEILVYLHSRVPPIIHRDIKPNNVIRRPNGELTLVDFGAVQLQRAGTMGGSTVIGTPGYMPLEQMLGQADPRSDLYALGVTVGHMLTGVEPSLLPLQNNRINFRSHMDRSVAEKSYALRLVERLTQPSKEDRFDSARAALAALQSSSSKKDPSAPNTLDLPSLHVTHASTLDAWFEPMRPWVREVKTRHRGKDAYTVVDRPQRETLDPPERELLESGFRFVGRQSAIKKKTQVTRSAWVHAHGTIYAIFDENKGETKLFTRFADDKSLTLVSSSAESVGAFQVRSTDHLPWNVARFQTRIRDAQEEGRRPLVGLDMDRLMILFDVNWFKPRMAYTFVRKAIDFSKDPIAPSISWASILLTTILLPVIVLVVVMISPLLGFIWLSEREERARAASVYAQTLQTIAHEEREGSAPSNEAFPALQAPRADVEERNEEMIFANEAAY